VSVPHTVLGLLRAGPRHGYDLKRAYDAQFAHARPLRYGQIYATLSRLQRDGLVILDTEEPGQRPDRKRYVITEDGATELQRWLHETEAPEPYLHSTLFEKVVLALLLGRDAAATLDAQRARHMARMRDLTELKRTGDTVDQLLSAHALFHLEADLRWIELTAARLDRLRSAVQVERPAARMKYDGPPRAARRA
jgi:DNA-binding PadR family transcriptional regulator